MNITLQLFFLTEYDSVHALDSSVGSLRDWKNSHVCMNFTLGEIHLKSWPIRMPGHPWDTISEALWVAHVIISLLHGDIAAILYRSIINQQIDAD